MDELKADTIIHKLANAVVQCPHCVANDIDGRSHFGLRCSGKDPLAAWARRRSCSLLHWGDHCFHRWPWPNYNMTEAEALAGLTPWDMSKAMSLWISRNNQLNDKPSASDIRVGIFQAIADVLGVEYC